MTKIVYSIEDMYLDAEGHAGFAEKGQDIVCAGISTLTQTLRVMLSEEEEKGHMTVWWLMENGRIRIRVNEVKSWKYGLIARTFFRMAVTGLKQIAEKYPEQIKVEEVQDGGIV